MYHQGTDACAHLYFMQVRYNVAELNKTLSDRLKLLSQYLLAFTGVPASQEELEAFTAYAIAVNDGNSS